MKDVTILKQNGIDVDSAIELLGDIEIYYDTLKDFLEVSETRMPKLEKYFQENDLENYAIEVHAMKSDSKYLGFTKLAEMSLEHQLKSEEGNKEYVKEHYQELIDEAKKIIKIVTDYLA